MRSFLSCLVLFLFSYSVQGQNVKIAIGASELAVNQVFTITVTLENERLRNYSPFPEIDGFLKRGTSSSTSTSSSSKAAKAKGGRTGGNAQSSSSPATSAASSAAKDGKYPAAQTTESNSKKRKLSGSHTKGNDQKVGESKVTKKGTTNGISSSSKSSKAPTPAAATVAAEEVKVFLLPTALDPMEDIVHSEGALLIPNSDVLPPTEPGGPVEAFQDYREEQEQERGTSVEGVQSDSQVGGTGAVLSCDYTAALAGSEGVSDFFQPPPIIPLFSADSDILTV